MTEVRVLTTGDAAKYIGVNFRTVIRWIERGKLKAFKLPGRGDHRIQVSDFVAFLQENQMPVPAELGGQNRSVLVIEDQPEMAGAIRRVLMRQGFDVQVANDGFSAGTLLSQMKPGLVTLDLKMPGMDGYEVLRFIRSHEDYAATKVLVISAEPQAGLEKAMALGASDVLPKPFENPELLVKVEALLA